MITAKTIEEAYTYPGYRKLIDSLFAQNTTTGNTQSEERVEFTKLNIQRMNRVEKTVSIPDNILNKINAAQPQTWLLIAEAWCGDCAQIIPVISKFAGASDGKINFKIILRDDNRDFICENLGCDALSIPKLLILNKDTLAIEKEWGSRPKTAHQIMLNWKANQDIISKHDFERELHLWYAKNRGQEIIEEISELI